MFRNIPKGDMYWKSAMMNLQQAETKFYQSFRGTTFYLNKIQYRQCEHLKSFKIFATRVIAKDDSVLIWRIISY